MKLPKPSALSLSIAALLSAGAAQASVTLIATSQIDGHQGDLATQTSAPLENGVPGNLLGGIGSGFTYAGCNSFLALPDRGPNAVSYNSLVDDTVSYINRFQTLKMNLTTSTPGSALPYTLTPTLTATTLLYSRAAVVYGDGSAAGLPNGAPSLNNKTTFYLTGRSDNFTPNSNSVYTRNGRLDPESIRVSADGQSVYISDEYGPYVFRFDRASGARTGLVQMPDMLGVNTLSAQGDVEISSNIFGRVANKGMEGLAISPDGSTLFGAMQSPLIQDGGTSAGYTRIVVMNSAKGTIAQYAYPLTNIGSDSKPKYPTISDIVAVNDHQFLVDERDGKGLGDDSTASFKKLFLIDINGAVDVTNLAGAAGLAPYAIAKTQFLDVVAALTAYGMNANDIPAKLEGVAFGPDISVDGVIKHTLWIANDNDFLPSITDSNHPNGINNPNQFFVFSVDSTDLPNYTAQQIAPPSSGC